MRRALLPALLCLLASSSAWAIDTATLSDPVQQQRYDALIHELRCLQCQGETIADTPAQFAVDIRRQVREMIASGSSDDQVREYLVERYGEIILLRPRMTWLWVLPGLLVLIGAIAAFRVVRRRGELLATDTSEPGDEELRT